jgi:hypothetical protein
MVRHDDVNRIDLAAGQTSRIVLVGMKRPDSIFPAELRELLRFVGHERRELAVVSRVCERGSTAV